MRDWKPSEVIAVVLLVVIIGFLAYVGISTEKDLVGEASSDFAADLYTREAPYYYGGRWHSKEPGVSTQPGVDVPFTRIYLDGNQWYLAEYTSSGITTYTSLTAPRIGARVPSDTATWSSSPGSSTTVRNIGSVATGSGSAATTAAPDADGSAAPTGGDGSSEPFGTDEAESVVVGRIYLDPSTSDYYYYDLNGNRVAYEPAASDAFDDVRLVNGILVDASGRPITPSGAAPAAPATLNLKDEVYTPAPTPATPTSTPGTTMGHTAPTNYRRLFEDKNNNKVYDNGDPYLFIPARFGTVTRWDGNTITADGVTWTVVKGGQMLTRTDDSGNVHRYEYRGKNSRYTVTDSRGDIQTQINFVPVVKELAPLFTSLDPAADYEWYGKMETREGLFTGMKITTVRGGVKQNRDVSYNPRTKTTRDVTVSTGATGQSTTRTVVTTQLGGGGTARWSGSTMDKPGTLVVRDAQGETFTGFFSDIGLSGQTFSSTDGNSFTSADGRITFDINTKTLTEGTAGRRTEVSFGANSYGAAEGDRTVRTFDDNREASMEIYHVAHDKNGKPIPGDYSEKVFKTNGDGEKEEAYTKRVTEQRAGLAGYLVFMKSASGITYSPVSAKLRDTNQDGKITLEDAQALGAESIFNAANKNPDGEIDSTEMQGILNERDGVVYSHDNIDDDNVPDAEKEDLNKADDLNQWRESVLGIRSYLAVPGDLLANYHSRQGISNLLFGKAFLDDWREQVDRAFAKSYLGVEYWTSDICKNEFDVVGDSVAGIEVAGGVFQFLGTVQGERAEGVPMLCDSNGECRVGTCRERDNTCIDSSGNLIMQNFYKITYGVRAPTDERFTPYDDEEGAISFNIVVSGRDKTASLFTQFVNLDNGESAASKAPQPSPILHYSPIVYDKVCLVFGKKPMDRNGNHVNLECNPIISATGSFENFRRNVDGAPGTGGREPLFNRDW